MLTYYVEWHMRRALSSLLYVEDDLPAARESRDSVAKARPTPASQRCSSYSRRTHNIEGLVFWKDGEPQCKIKRSDFGFKWPDKPLRVEF